MEQYILEELKKESNPYLFEVQKQIGIQFRRTAYDVGKIAMKHSNILDRCIAERKEREEREAKAISGLHFPDEIKEQLARYHANELPIVHNWREQDARESADRIAAGNLVQELTPEFLISLSNHPKCQFVR